MKRRFGSVWSACTCLLLTTACGSDGSSPGHSSIGGTNSGGTNSGGTNSGGTSGAGGSVTTGGTGGSGGASGGASGASGGGGAAGGTGIIPAMATCSPSGSSCGGGKDSGVYASYRKDHFFPDTVYNEYTDSPTAGGRFHIALVSAVDGEVTQTLIDGWDTAGLATQKNPPLEWLHVWPHQVKAGEPFFVQFHSRDAKWDTKTTGSLKVVTSGGVAFDGSFPVAATKLPITWVTTTDDHKTLVVHAKNTDSVAHTLSKFLVNASDVTAAACIPQKTIAAGAEVVLTLPLCQPAKDGEVWTVVMQYSDAASGVGVGRVLPEHFPVATWNNTSDCPFPGANAANYDKHIAAGIDTFFLSGPSSSSGCSFDPMAVVAAAAQSPAFQLMVGSSTALGTTIPDPSGIAALMTGDESDGQVYDGTGISNAAGIAKEVDALWKAYPDRPTYNGGKTNGNDGTFSGTDDIQGMDVYIGGCAPHITAFGSGTPPRMPYDYLFNTRNNHMPLPTWLYAQGLSPVSAWKAQPTASEVYVQAMSVVAAGGKGLMWFQSNMDKANTTPASWDAMSNVGRMLHGVRDLLREGDPTGLASSDPSIIVEAIRARDAVVVPAIDVATTAGPTDLTCALFSTPWTFASMKPNVTVTIPDDLAVVDVFEVTTTAAHVVDVAGYQVSGRQLTFLSVPLDNTLPVRLYVLAASTEVRKRVLNAMAYP